MGKTMKSVAMALLVAAGGQWSLGEVTLDIADQAAAAGSTFTFPAVFSVAPAETINSVGYQVALKITGPDNGLTITGATAAATYGSAGNLAYVPSNGTMPEENIYAFTDFLVAGFGVIENGKTFATFTGQLAPGAVGPYQVDWYLVDDGAYKSMIFDEIGNELPVAFTGGIIAVPEPASLMALTGIAGLLLGRRRIA